MLGPYGGVSGLTGPDPALSQFGAASRLRGFTPARRIGGRPYARQVLRRLRARVAASSSHKRAFGSCGSGISSPSVGVRLYRVGPGPGPKCGQTCSNLL